MAAGSITSQLGDIRHWQEVVGEYEERFYHRVAKLSAYQEIVNSDEPLRLARCIIDGSFQPTPPTRKQINKASGKKKIIYAYPPREDLLFKVLNRVLQGACAQLVSPLCFSFQCGRSAIDAFRHLLGDSGIAGKHCLHMDVRDYFNSIDVDRFLTGLPAALRHDEPLFNLVRTTLTDPRVRTENGMVQVEQKGLMAGTPLAPFLSNLFLRDLDEHFRAGEVAYARYSDDMIVFGSRSEIVEAEQYIRDHLRGLGLAVNEEKTRRSGPGAVWEYLGLAFHDGELDVSANTERKLKGKTRRLARQVLRLKRRRGMSSDAALAYFVRRLNRKFYGAAEENLGFCWARWFFPLLSTDATLRRLDAYVQEKLRYSVSGRHSKGNYKCSPYARLQAAGYIPLVSAFHRFRDDRAEYFALLEERAGLRRGRAATRTC